MRILISLKVVTEIDVPTGKKTFVCTPFNSSLNTVLCDELHLLQFKYVCIFVK